AGSVADGRGWDGRRAEGGAGLGVIVPMGDARDPGPDMFLGPARDGREIWVVSGSDVIHTAPPPAPPETGVARVHYLNPAGELDGWVLHVWEDTIAQVTWGAGLPPTGEVPGGRYWEVRRAADAGRRGLISHRAGADDAGPGI